MRVLITARMPLASDVSAIRKTAPLIVAHWSAAYTLNTLAQLVYVEIVDSDRVVRKTTVELKRP